MTTTIDELIARVEQGEGVDRELDAQIWLFATPGASRKATHINHPKGPYTIDETRDADHRLITVPCYTTSIDAVVALIEQKLPGSVWDVSSTGGAWINGGGIMDQEYGHAPSPARALLAAFLKSLRPIGE